MRAVCRLPSLFKRRFSKCLLLLVSSFYIISHLKRKNEQISPMIPTAHNSYIIRCVYSACIFGNLRPTVSQTKVHKQTVLHKIVTGEAVERCVSADFKILYFSLNICNQHHRIADLVRCLTCTRQIRQLRRCIVSLGRNAYYLRPQSRNFSVNLLNLFSRQVITSKSSR